MDDPAVWVWVGLALVAGLVVGGVLGVITMACCVVAGRADREMVE